MAPQSCQYSASSAAGAVPKQHFGDESNEQQKCAADEDTSKIKCVLVGDGAVGKTSLIVSYTTNGYPQEYLPTAFDNYSAVVQVDGKPVKLQLCDTAGQDDFDSLRPLCYPDTDVFLLCFSVMSPASFHNILEKWVEEMREHAAPHVPLVLVGTQSDLRNDVRWLIQLAHYNEQPVSAGEASMLAEQIGAAAYVECSSLTQSHLKDVFDSAILAALAANNNNGQRESAYNDSLPAGLDTWRSRIHRWSKRCRASAADRPARRTLTRTKHTAAAAAAATQTPAPTRPPRGQRLEKRAEWKYWCCLA